MQTQGSNSQTKTADVAEFRAQVKAKVGTVSGLRAVMSRVASMAGKDWLEGHLILAAALSPATANPEYLAVVERIINAGEDPDESEDDNASPFDPY